MSLAPRQVKQALTGHGGADKTQIQYMVRALLRLVHTPTADEADALAIAWALVNRQQASRLQQAR